jgi:hypothetical protein
MSAKSGSDVAAGNWYHGFLCDSCDQQLALLDDPSEGKKPAAMSAEARFRIVCPHCAAEHAYEASSIAQFQAKT